ncbi:galactose oxidase-like domain-containing protein [Streptomyces sp. NPDC059009]|uniref:galactose oxidase-like domain-containing protein n=1 Tax=Streptomyces sp. NPDC059009 TaxID=3346694 RepID=UPI0036C8FF8A
MDVYAVPAGGRWEKVGDLGIVAVHSALLRKGKGTEIAMWSPPRARDENGDLVPKKDEPGQYIWDLYARGKCESRSLDPATMRTRDQDMHHGMDHAMKTNIFCGAGGQMPDGTLLVLGGLIIPTTPGEQDSGDAHGVFVYDTENPKRWTALDTMALPRWYPTITTMPDGRMLISSGSTKALVGDGTDKDPVKGYFANIHNNYEVFDPITRTMTGVGKVELVDLKRLPSQTGVPEERKHQLSPGFGHEPAHPRARRTDRLLRQTPRPRRGPEMTASAEIFDIDTRKAIGKQSGWRATGRMHHARFLCDATMLADGTLLVSGGARTGYTNKNTDYVLQAEIYDPATEQFTVAATARTDRRYHATAMLLPEGTVLKAGSTGGYDDSLDAMGQYKHLHAHTDGERFYPEYMWRPRPELVDAADLKAGYGKKISVDVQGPTAGLGGMRLAIVKLGSTTHGNEMSSRYVWLDVTGHKPAARGGEGVYRIAAKTPVNPAAAPPGDYMLIAVDAHGTPSEAGMVTIG